MFDGRFKCGATFKVTGSPSYCTKFCDLDRPFKEDIWDVVSVGTKTAVMYVHRCQCSLTLTQEGIDELEFIEG